MTLRLTEKITGSHIGILLSNDILIRQRDIQPITIKCDGYLRNVLGIEIDIKDKKQIIADYLNHTYYDCCSDDTYLISSKTFMED